MNLVARQKEKDLLDQLKISDKAEFLVLYGRRRVGKTYLIREHYKGSLYFELTGVKGASLKTQLNHFHHSFSAINRKATQPISWQDAFYQLQHTLQKKRGKKKYVIFIDELPWLASPRSGFLQALDHFWNTFASRDPRCILVICGSAASWMVKKVIHDKGGLHNRITQQLHLKPFNLHDFSTYLKHLGLELTRYDQAMLYMAIGGIPHYLNFLSKGKSVPQLIDELCFHEQGFLRNEFNRLYASLFDHSEYHEKIVRLLAKHSHGLTRHKIAASIRSISSGGRLTNYLSELVHAGFLTFSNPYGNKKKEAIYRLTDEYSLFYLKWIEGSDSQAGTFLTLQSRQSWKTWCGYAFENMALKHTNQLKQALGISQVHTTTHSWLKKASSTQKSGAQIDLLLDRADHIINLIESKFYSSPFTVTKRYAEDLRNKKAVFQEATKSKKTLFLTMLTSHGITENSYSRELIQNSLTLDCLFDKS